MPTYATKCSECRREKDFRLSYTQYEEVRAGERQLDCAECGKTTSLVFDPGNFGFTLKDGESGGWASKSMKENNYRKDRARVMARREKDHVFKNKLVPNYKGEETGTWREAQEVAKVEKGVEAAVTYEPLVQKEVGAT